MKDILRTIIDDIFSTFFVITAFGTIVGAGAIDFDTAGSTVLFVYGTIVACFVTSIVVLLIKFFSSADETSNGVR